MGTFKNFFTSKLKTTIATVDHKRLIHQPDSAGGARSSTFTQNAASGAEYQNIIKSIRSLHITSEGIISNGGITIEKDAATFHLISGTIYRFSNVANKECFLFFKGKGQFSFEPPSKIEQDQLERFCEKKSLND